MLSLLFYLSKIF